MPATEEHLNLVATGGMFGTRRRLGTMTIHQHENGRYFVTDEEIRMANITVHFRDGTKQEFKHSGRPGGSYTKSVKYEGNFVIVTDEYHNLTAVPMDLIKEVKVDERGGW